MSNSGEQGHWLETLVTSVQPKTDFKFKGKVESQTNIFLKFSSCSFNMIFFFQKPMGSLIYMPNYSGKKNWSLIHSLSRLLDYVPSKIGRFHQHWENFCWNAAIWRPCGQRFLSFSLHAYFWGKILNWYKRNFYEC